MIKICLVLGFVAVVAAQRQNSIATTPVPILRQVNSHNEDGSYTYGFEAGDGSYKVETKTKEGEVKGKYGFYNPDGKLIEIEYGATRNGFIPSGTDIRTPTLPDNVNVLNDDGTEDDGQYYPGKYEAPYNTKQTALAPARKTRPRAQGRRVSSVPQDQYFRSSPPQQQQQQYYEPQQYQQPQQQYQPQQQQYHQQQYHQQQQQYYQQPQQPYYQQPQQPYYQQPQQAPGPQVPAFNQKDLFRGHPATNLDLNTGSYSINY